MSAACRDLYNGKTGKLIQPENAEELAENISFFAADNSRIAVFGKEASKHARDNFGIDKMVQNVRSIYDKILITNSKLKIEN